MTEIILINIGTMVSLFCGYKFAVTHLTRSYAGLFDLCIRCVLVVGMLSGSLLMPIWLQKSRFPSVNVGYFLIGPYLAIVLAGLTAWLERKGRLRWPKDRLSK